MAFYHGARGAPYIKLTTDHWQLLTVITPAAAKKLTAAIPPKIRGNQKFTT
jgi:hypothetical protein